MAQLAALAVAGQADRISIEIDSYVGALEKPYQGPSLEDLRNCKGLIRNSRDRGCEPPPPGWRSGSGFLTCRFALFGAAHWNTVLGGVRYDLDPN